MRYFKWQLRARLFGKPLQFQFTPNSKMWLAPGLRGASGNYYCGLHEFEDMVFVMHLLIPGDLFVDVGANVGSYSLIAAAECHAEVLSFEPVPGTYNWLIKNIADNDLNDWAKPFCIAIGSTNGKVNFTSTLDAQNHVSDIVEDNTIVVEMDTLDNLLYGRNPFCIKIDVEGFEDQVLAGAANTIVNSGVSVLVIEMTNKIFPKQSNIRCHDWLLLKGFNSYTYNPWTRELILITQPNSHNTIYLRSKDKILNRLKASPKRAFWGQWI